MNKIKIFLILVSATFVVSCTSHTYDEISLPVANPTYSVNIEPVFKANCTECHNSGEQFPPLENYTEVRAATENGKVLCRIDGKSCGSIMPPSGRMTQGTINMINLWATNGYKN